MNTKYYIPLILLALSFINFYKGPYWVAFFSELFSFLSIFFFIFFLKKFFLTKGQILFYIFLSFIILIQFIIGKIIFFSNFFLVFVYLSGFILVFGLSSKYCGNNNFKIKIFKIFSFLFLFLGVFSSFVAIFQWLKIDNFLLLLYGVKEGRVVGTLGQPNNFASFLMLSFLSLSYLACKNYLKYVYYFLFSSLILFSIVLTLSRTALLYFILVSIFLLFFIKSKKILFKFVVQPIMFLILSNLIIHYLNRYFVNPSSNLIDRLNSGYLRFDIWTQSLHSIVNMPFWGYGWNQTSIAQMKNFYFHPNTEWYTSAHNIIIDLLLWNGLFFGLIFCLFFIFWLFELTKYIKSVEAFFAFLMVLVFLNHSMLEFPLYYAYFLFIFGFLLGVIESDNDKIKYYCIDLRKYNILLLGVVFFFIVVITDYSKFQYRDNNIYILTELKFKIWYNDFNDVLTDDLVAYIEPRVYLNPTYYNLCRYSLILRKYGYFKKSDYNKGIIEKVYPNYIKKYGYCKFNME